MRQIVFASGNAGKAREIRALFRELFGSDVELLLQGELGVESVEETGVTFRENALLKARHAAAATGLPALADDSGIEVDALNGAPGVYSSRFAGVDASDQDNVEKLLSDLLDTPVAKRTARFRCVLAYVRNPADSAPLVADGVWEGAIAGQQSGTDGFGYDPVFIDADSGMTAAELSPEQKNVRSHRGKALVQLRSQLSMAGL
ncbi:RdgB/HAM1 family non-canonical purine NTP pyrophosphatase [Gammaproteobacteria bacterium]|nr:RdgB/HAM1 family non-canonical purine NTP pyrophosphatase [Gammaproteobacteria bacterium]